MRWSEPTRPELLHLRVDVREVLTGTDLLPVIPWGVMAANLALAILGLVGIRTVRRFQHEQHETNALRDTIGDPRRTRVILLGAGRAGAAIARELEADRIRSCRRLASWTTIPPSTAR